MNALLDFFNSLGQEALAGFLTIAALGSVVLGLVADRVMHERGFGPIGNGLLIFMGVCVGLSMAFAEVGPRRSAEPDRIVVLATAASTAVLLICGTLKSWILSED